MVGSEYQLAQIAINMSTVEGLEETRPYFPLAGVAHDGWSNENEATATCFCGAVQLSFVSLVLSV